MIHFRPLCSISWMQFFGDNLAPSLENAAMNSIIRSMFGYKHLMTSPLFKEERLGPKPEDGLITT